MRAWNVVFLFFGVLFFSVSVFPESLIAPKTCLSDSFLPMAPTEPHLDFSRGMKGMELFLRQMRDSDLTRRILIQPLEARNLDLSIQTESSSFGEVGYLNVDVFPKSPETQHIIKTEVQDLQRDIGDITSLNETSLGRIKILMASQNGHSVPILWEIQPSASWRRIESLSLHSTLKESNWRKDTIQALARYFVFFGFKEVYARSLESMKSHPKYSPMADGGVKKHIHPIDLEKNYHKPFANRNLWEASVHTSYLLFKDSTWLSRENPLYRYQKPDLSLKSKGIRHYRFREVPARRGFSLLVVLENQESNLRFSWEFSTLISKIKTPVPEALNTVEALTRHLRFAQKIPLFYARPEVIHSRQAGVLSEAA